MTDEERALKPPGRWSVLAPLVLAVAFWALGLALPALLLLGVSIALVVLRWVRPDAAARLAGWLARFGLWVGTGLQRVLLASVYGLLFLPIGVVRGLLGRGRVRLGRATLGRWQDRAPRETSRLASRPFGLDPRTNALDDRTMVGRAAGFLPQIAGWAVVIVAVNFGVGWVWDQVAPEDVTEPPALAVARGEPDPRVDTAALADSPWAEGYLAELASLDYEFLPFIQTRMRPFEGRFITGGEGVRASEQVVAEDAGAPVVWFFGGSTMWGEGQRDDHTIPSEFARLSEEAGTPVRVVNYGERGYVSRQEFELFEQLLATEEPPDLAVFYDGTNDVNVQRPDFNADRYLESRSPLIYDAAGVNGGLADTTEARRQAEDLYDRYVDHSLVHELVDGIRGVFGFVPAHAAVDDADEIVDRSFTVYARTRRLIQGVADESGVPVVFFWQPESSVEFEDSEYSRVAELVGPETNDISDALDAVDADSVYIDGGHTNELGARLVAERIWDELSDQIAGFER